MAKQPNADSHPAKASAFSRSFGTANTSKKVQQKVPHICLLEFVQQQNNAKNPSPGLRVIRGHIMKNWRPKSTGFDIEGELNHFVERLGYGIREIEIAYRKRVGEKKLELKHGFPIAKRIILESTN